MPFLNEIAVPASATAYVKTDGITNCAIVQVYRDGKTGTYAYVVSGTITNPSTNSTTLLPFGVADTPPTKVDCYPYIKIQNAGTADLIMTVREPEP